MAGALGLKLAGPRVYGTELTQDAFMGSGRAEATAQDIRSALHLYRRALMVQALDASWMALAFAHFADEHEMRVTDEVLAQHILENIAAGERRLSVLSGNALGALEPRAAKRPDGHAQGPLWRDPGDRVDVIEVVRRVPARWHPS